MLKPYLEKLSLKVVHSEQIIHEDSLSSSIFKLICEDETFILKITFNEERFRREKYYLNKVKDYIPVPKIIDLVEPTKELKGAILMQYLPSSIVFAVSLNNDLAYQMGALLAKLHQIPTRFYEDKTKGENLEPTLENGKYILKDYFERSFNECKNTLDINLLKHTEKYFYLNLEKITSLDGPCITHRDFKPGNIIIDNNKITGLIDWEIACNNFAEEDFCQMHYLVWDDYPNTKEAFFKGYQSIRKLPDLSCIIPLLRVSKSLGSIGFTVERNTYNNIHKHVYDKNVNYLKSFFNL
jgi:aminoglycoside phosphotransferase (APT) family kinase protein